MITSNVSRFRDMADRLEAEIADKRRSREENTPKKQLQAKTARIEADHLERVQRAMYALAEAQENDRLPENLKAIKTNSQLMTMLKTRLDGSRGYYELIDTGEYSDKSELAVTLRAFIESCKSEAEAARDAEQQRLNKIKDMEAQVRFGEIKDFFPSPPAVIERMLAMIQHYEDGGVILDSSAGKGNLLDAAIKRWPKSHCVFYECNYTLVEILEAKGFDGVRGDFLEEPTKPIVDLALINPPYSSGQDCLHIRHTYDFLKPGGEMVALASAGIKWNKQSKFESFRMWLTEMDATLHDLPPDSFNTGDSFRKSGVSVVMIYLRKPE